MSVVSSLFEHGLTRVDLFEFVLSYQTVLGGDPVVHPKYYHGEAEEEG